MATQTAWVTENDMNRLTRFLQAAGEREEGEALPVLKEKLREAKITRSKNIPDDVVTMNSCVRLLHDGSTSETEYWLRFPDNTTVLSRGISILSNLGMALLGSKEGESIEWATETGVRKSRIVEIVYQPERLGNFEH